MKIQTVSFVSESELINGLKSITDNHYDSNFDVSFGDGNHTLLSIPGYRSKVIQKINGITEEDKGKLEARLNALNPLTMIDMET